MGEESVDIRLEIEKAKVPLPPQPQRTHFVLVHGIGGGGWCWYKIRSLMENSGYKVTCLDLKGAGIDQADPNTIISFDEYNKPLIDFLSSTLPDSEQVILVGHSAGGLSVTDATHKFAKKVKVAVYIAATMLRTGFVTTQDVKDGVPDLSDFGEFADVYDIGFGSGPEQPPTSIVIKKSLQRKIIYQISPLEDSTLATMLLRPGPIQALQSARFKEGGEGAERVPRIYIRTARDRVMKPEQQDAMIRKWQPQHVCTLESDHSPFFSAPFTLFGLFVKVAASF
ncbi:methylesterase 17-like [Nicotiana sylvestris]|uniref:Methylesterase 17-like n=1 Tax=Nicotiana sylvestris TaxID=4096 RepID=A0A1U7XDZ0_NICSY|nr:PREDICTED: methylesterase 17-like [Nicotiana sylvestris]